MGQSFGGADVKARKEHNCFWCGEKIVVGEVYRKWCYVDCGDFTATKVHLECDEAWLSLTGCDADEIYQYGQSRGCTCENNNCYCEEKHVGKDTATQGV